MDITKGDSIRFINKVDMSSECWVWTASTNIDGYGRFWLGGKYVRAHRFSYSLVYGIIPSGMCICHTCDNPGCVRPSHLFVGTNSDNQKDAIAKGRHKPAQGEKNGRSKLTENDVREIRRLYFAGTKQPLLAKMWRISSRQISDIVCRKKWKHI